MCCHYFYPAGSVAPRTVQNLNIYEVKVQDHEPKVCLSVYNSRMQSRRQFKFGLFLMYLCEIFLSCDISLSYLLCIVLFQQFMVAFRFSFYLSSYNMRNVRCHFEVKRSKVKVTKSVVKLNHKIRNGVMLKLQLNQLLLMQLLTPTRVAGVQRSSASVCVCLSARLELLSQPIEY